MPLRLPTILPRFAVFAVFAVVLAGTALDAAASGLPSPGNCTIPTCINASPDGLFVTQLVVRDATNTPIAYSSVTLDFSSCTSYLSCVPPCYGCTGNLSARTITALTNTSGVANFDLRVGGVCPNQIVSISADNVPLGTARFASLDQTGDLYVTLADVIRVQSLIGTGDNSANFDCSGTVNASDVALVQLHVGATCTGVVPSLSRTWGRVKVMYR